jgi:hypothetical protein
MQSARPQVKCFVKVDMPREAEPSVPSLTPLYPGADWQEREVYDLFGIRFEGHPNLRRILLWEGYPGWPLRKDYVHVPDRYDNGQEIGLPVPSGGVSGLPGGTAPAASPGEGGPSPAQKAGGQT